MRGKDVASPTVAGVSRITPAYAGKSRRQLPRSCTVQDHPRLCGEKGCEIMYLSIYEGSPPPMRGKGPPAKMQQFCAGITPAYAGKSMPAPPASMPARDHPRLCGEKAFKVPERSTKVGSPPPMRGKEAVEKAAVKRSGITHL